MAGDASGLSVKRLIALKRDMHRSLSARLLNLTIAFVFLAEILILAPSLGAFHRVWLQDRVNAAQIAALALEASPDARVTADLRQKLLENAEVGRVALTRAGARQLRLDGPPTDPRLPVHAIDLRNMMVAAVYDALDTMLAPPGRQLRVLAKPRFETGDLIEVVMAEAPLKHDLAAYAWRALAASLFISMLNGLVLYLVLNWMFVRPMRRLTAQIERFRDSPEDVSAALTPSRRVDEIGRAERALADMETQVRAALRQRERLAGLGGAVAKLAHDLRNSLSTASLMTERLAQSEDPHVRQAAPRLERAVSRAVSLAEAALRYGRAEENVPRLRPLAVAEALNEAADDALAAYPQIEWSNTVQQALRVAADSDHFHRIAVNVLRNAARALAAQHECGGRIEARSANARSELVIIELVNDGPPIAEAVREHLFEPFSASRGGGAGLGLSIGRELARAMGGDLELVSSGAEGVCFAITLRPAPALVGAPSPVR